MGQPAEEAAAGDEPVGVVVLGPYRSGTSLVTQILGMLGVDLGPSEELFEATRYNPAGYFQRPDVTRANTRFIESAGGSLADPGDPRRLFERGEARFLRSLHLDWLHASPLWGLKDPRFCATLWTWVGLGLIGQRNLLIVRVRRSIETTTRSAVKHYDVKTYCDGTLSGARAMFVRYEELADWHIKHLSVPTLDVDFEQLSADPEVTIDRVAGFLGIADPERVDRCVGLVGRNKALVRYYASKLIGGRSPRQRKSSGG